MIEKIFSRHNLSKIITDEDAFAIADKNQKIIWYNQKFKFHSGITRIKGKPIFHLFKVSPPDGLADLPVSQSLTYPVLDKKINLTITILRRKKTLEGYLLQVMDDKSKSIPAKEVKFYQQNLFFQTELQQILSLLVKENSIPVISQEILIRSIKISGCRFGIIVFQDDKKHLDYLIFDPDGDLTSRK